VVEAVEDVGRPVVRPAFPGVLAGVLAVGSPLASAGLGLPVAYGIVVDHGGRSTW
jgi:hypothetical protein